MRLPENVAEILMDLRCWERSIPANCLADKLVFVTGAQHMSIGGAAVYGLLSHCGARVVYQTHSQQAANELNAFLSADLNCELPRYFVVDFEDTDAAAAMASGLQEAPWAIFHIAGVSEYLDITIPDSHLLNQRIFNINYQSPFRITQALAQKMVETHRDPNDMPRILFTSSVHSQRVCAQGNAAYSMTKSGQAALARDIAQHELFTGRLFSAAMEFGWIDVIRHRLGDEVFAAMEKARMLSPSRKTPTASEAALQYVKLCLPGAEGYNGGTLAYDSGQLNIWP